MSFFQLLRAQILSQDIKICDQKNSNLGLRLKMGQKPEESEEIMDKFESEEMMKIGEVKLRTGWVYFASKIIEVWSESRSQGVLIFV